MKRCSQCEFTFENHLQFCDFDNTELTVVPERAPSFTNISPPPSLFIRLARSRVSLAVLAFAGVMLSALLVGYVDSASQPKGALSSADSENERVNPDSQSQELKPDEAKPDQTAALGINVQEPRISAEGTASAVTASVFSKEPAVSHSQWSRPERSTLRREAISPSGVGASKGNRAKANGESLARRRRRTSPTAVLSDGSESEISPQKRDSKVVAILKKTGNILAKPFKF